MIRSSYVANGSGWIFLTTGGLVIGVTAPDDAPLVAELWALAESGAETGAVLDALTRGGISSAPDFAIVRLGAGGKVVVRGAATVVVVGSEAASLDGGGLSSWAERSFDRIDGFSCEIVASASASASGSGSGSVDAAPLPLLSGAVRAGWFASSAVGTPGVVVAAPAKPALVGPVETPVVELVETPPVIPAPAPISAPPAPPISSAPSEATVAAVDEVDEPDEPDDEPAAEPLSTGPAGGGGKPTAYDFLFGETAYRSVEDAAVRPPGDEAADPESGPSRAIEDHTVVASDLAQLRAQRRAGRGRAVEPLAPVAAFLLELSTGGQELLDQPLVIGRAPSATALGGGKIPRLVTMTTPNQDISRTHAQISVEGGTVVVTDLHSSNGTIVILPGRPAQKLREGETTVVIPGTVIDLGDGATLTVREV